jgi:ComF family protein
MFEHPISSHLASKHPVSNHLVSSHLVSSHLVSDHPVSNPPVSGHPIFDEKVPGIKLVGKRRPLSKLRRLFSNARFLLVQERCRLCDRFIHPEIPHYDYTNYAPPARYLINGKSEESDVICRTCCKPIRFSKPVWSNLFVPEGDRIIRALPVFSGTNFENEPRKLVHAFKYEADILLVKDLTILAYRAWRLLTQIMAVNRWNSHVNKPILVPVPLHWWRERKRGFNQSELIAKELGKTIGLKVARGALARTRNTAPQQQLSRSQRANNLLDAFEGNDSIVDGKTIILIDDVLTTGATMIECAQALRKAGAKSVLGLTVARVELDSSSH